MLCGPSLEPFLRFAYVGAPWQPAEDWVRGKPWLAGVGGNGGLSLRRRSLSLACLDAASRQRGQWEDAFFVEVRLAPPWRYWYALHGIDLPAAAPPSSRRLHILEYMHVHVRVQALQQLGHSVAPAREARGFAVESVWHEAPCGMHKAYNYLPAAQLAHLLRGVERAYGRLAEAPKEGALRPESMGAQSSPSVSALEAG